MWSCAWAIPLPNYILHSTKTEGRAQAAHNNSVPIRNVYVLRCTANSKSNRHSHAKKTSENSGKKQSKVRRRRTKKKNIMRTDNDGDPTLVS